MKLITEEIESVEFLVEQKNGKKSMYIEGVFLQGNITNRNGRMYPAEGLRKEVSRYNENHIQSGRALGELGHPEGPTVNLDRVSHKIVSLRESGSNFVGKAKILNTPMGKIASSLIAEGVKGSPFAIGDTVSLSGKSGWTFEHAHITPITYPSYTSDDQRTVVTVSYDSSGWSGTWTDDDENPSGDTGTLRRSLMVAARTDTSSGKIYIQQVQITGDA